MALVLLHSFESRERVGFEGVGGAGEDGLVVFGKIELLDDGAEFRRGEEEVSRSVPRGVRDRRKGFWRTLRCLALAPPRWLPWDIADRVVLVLVHSFDSEERLRVGGGDDDLVGFEEDVLCGDTDGLKRREFVGFLLYCAVEARAPPGVRDR